MRVRHTRKMRINPCLACWVRVSTGSQMATAKEEDEGTKNRRPGKRSKKGCEERGDGEKWGIGK